MIDRDEFKKVMIWVCEWICVGKFYVYGFCIGFSVFGDVEDVGLVYFFFGSDGKW